MSYFDVLLQKRGLTEPTSFWKLNIQDEEIDELIDYIHGVLSENSLDWVSRREKNNFFRSFDREACLMYALWWNRKYDGRKVSWSRPFEDFNIDDKYLNIVKDAVIRELINNRRLKITVYRSDSNSHMYLQSVLAQGGLPMSLMNGDNCTSFENFLFYLISEYEEMDVRDWTNVSIAQRLADKYLNNKTFINSEAVLEFAMEIVKAYICNDDTAFSNYEEIKTIIAHIREKRGKLEKQDRKFFKINWELRFESDKLNLFYSVMVPNEIIIKNDTIANNNHVITTVSYYIANRLIGVYHRQGSRFLLMPGTSTKSKTKWDASVGHLTLIRKIGNEISEEHSLINSTPPYLEEPLLLQFKSGSWVPKHIKNNDTFACLAPETWTCDKLSSCNQFIYNNVKYCLFDVDWNRIEGSKLVFNNKQTNEEVCLDNNISSYSVSFIPSIPSWIENSSAPIVINCDDIKKCFLCFENDSPCSRNGFKFLYKSLNESTFNKYSGGYLPCGLIKMKVICPDGGYHKVFSFYNIKGLNYQRVSNDTLKIDFTHGSYALLAGQEVTKLMDNSSYQILDTKSLKGFAPIKFRFYVDGIREFIDIGFTSPIQMSCFIDNAGNILEKGFPVSMSELYKFKVNLSDASNLVLSYWGKTDGNFKKCMVKKNIHLKAGRYSLDMFKDDIDRLVCMCGFNDYRKYLTLKIAKTDAEIIIRRDSYQAQQFRDSEGNMGLLVKRNIKAASGLHLRAIAINALKESPLYHKDDIVLLEPRSDGMYFLPVLEDEEIKDFIVFTDNVHSEGSMPAFLFNIENDMDKSLRDQNKRSSIEHIASSLFQNDDEEWKNIWFYMDIVIKYRLSYYNSFNSFFAIVNNPSLLVSFLVRLTTSELMQQYDKNTIVEELQRMEKELSFRFHYLPSIFWIKEFKQLQNLYETQIKNIQVLANQYNSSIDFADQRFILLKELLLKQFGDENMPKVYYSLLGHTWPTIPSFANYEREYLMKINDALEDFDSLRTPDGLRFANVEYIKNLKSWNSYEDTAIIQKLQYLAIVLPQCAAQYAHGGNHGLWNYLSDDLDESKRINSCNEFTRRMINYMSIYATQAYNELFITALLRKPINQIIN